ncbi:E3 ubiquitin-protein ligase MIB2-like [Ostrea edulis]|uniref:E3 ubiquitin-protein ligase MIB2-like n=1 Tax=Ostrea edulis TaxID=37623 RepID=UPI0024AF66CD|nr:E3 ubiquitin-protein ligase MIB2-like [Ostrea edulis]
MTSIKAGTRVVRGPDWASKKQDNGEGFLGTIIFVPKSGSSDNQVTVIWDSGRELRYRAGHDGKYDLRVYDTAPAGIKHDGVTCDACDEHPLKGIRWKCSNCDDYDLCNLCYMNDQHDTGHSFVRIDTDHCRAVHMPPRKTSKTIIVKGLFPKAEVIRGPHWKWKNDDGGEGEVGRIQEVVMWDKKFHRGGVRVQWKNDSTSKDYRVGGEGCVDVIYTRMKETASGGKYYPDHIPVVDVVNPGVILLKPGDKVRIHLSLKDFRRLQDDDVYGGWEDKMEECVENLGTIVQILFQGKTCRVQYEDGTVWSINRAALTRIHTFKQGEPVTVLSDYNVVKDLQEGHGGWNDDMKPALGKNGRIVKVDPDGDIRVKIDERTWIFSPVCIMPVENAEVAKEIPAIPATECSDSDSESTAAPTNDVAEAIAQLFVDMLRGMPGHAAGTISIVQAAGQGDLQAVKEIIKKFPEKVDQTIEGKTALQIAAYEGNVDVVQFLLENNADPNLKDKEDDSPLHYSAFGKEHKTMGELLKRGADANIVNKSKQTPLHISVGKGSVECVKLLLEHKANPSLKDKDGDTVMHDAISQKELHSEIIQSVIGSRLANYKETNTKGFNVLQWAAMKDSRLAVSVVIDKNKSIVDDKMAEGFTALHIAVANDFVEISSALIHRGNCNVNVTDKDKRTPLIICVSQGHKRTMEVLLAASCNVNAQDINGNTALHVAQTKKSLPGLIQRKHEDKNMDTQIICSLLEAKADINIKNLENKSPLDLAEDDMVKQFMILLSKKASSSTLTTTKRGVGIPADWEQMGKGEAFKRVSLSPDGGGMSQKEYQMVADKFRKTLGQAKILQIERIQNMYNWECYYLKRIQMEQKYGGSGCSNERELFHGTLPNLVDVICKDNLDFRLAGERVGALFGKGTYFASDAKYSDLYAQVDKDRSKYMFLVKVLCGNCALGDPKYARPPPVDPKNPISELYDCCVDNLDNPRVFCVFDKNQYYPQYLVKYK